MKNKPSGAAPSVQPTPTAMEALRVELVVQKATNLSLKKQLADLQGQYDLLQFTVELDRLTPPALAGYVWNWTNKPGTNQPIGYVKATEGS